MAGHLTLPLALAALLGAAAALLVPLLSPLPGHSGDTMEFQLIAERFGVPHPPGAPAYTVLVHGWRHLLGFATAALAANLLSAVLALVMLVLAVELLRRWTVPALIAALALSGLFASPLFLRLATVAELYVPALAATLACLLCVERWRDGRDARWLLAAGACCGIGTAIHPQVLLAAPAAVLLAVAEDPGLVRRRAAWQAVAVTLGVLAALTGVTAVALRHPATPFTWTDADSLADVLRFLTGSSLRAGAEPLTAGEMVSQRLPRVLGAVLGPLRWLLPLATVAMAARWRRPEVWAVGWLLLVNVAYVVVYPVWDAEDFVLPGQLAVAMLAAMGLATLWPGGAVLPRGGVRLGAAVAVAGLGLTLGVQQWLRIPEARALAAQRTLDASWATRAERRLELAAGGVIASPVWDDSAALWYQVLVHPERHPDVAVVHHPAPADVIAYVRDGAPLWRPQERRLVPPGRDLFVVREAFAEALVDSGLVAYALDADLHLIRAAVDTTVTDRWPQLAPQARVAGRCRWRLASGFGPQEHWGRWLLADRGRVELRDVPAGAVLVLAASSWLSGQPVQEVAVWRDGEVVGQVSVDTPPWQPERFVIPLALPEPRDRLTLELRCEPFAAQGDRPRGLPISGFAIVAPDSG